MRNIFKKHILEDFPDGLHKFLTSSSRKKFFKKKCNPQKKKINYCILATKKMLTGLPKKMLLTTNYIGVHKCLDAIA